MKQHTVGINNNMNQVFTPHTISKRMKAKLWNSDYLLTNINKIKKALYLNNKEISDECTVEFLNFIFQASILPSQARKYYNQCRDFNLDRYKNYLSSRKQGDNSSFKYLYNLYGKYAQEMRDKISASRSSPWDPKSYSKNHGISLQEAKEKISNILKNKSTSLEGFIRRHGQEVGTRMFKEWRQKCLLKKETFLTRYGQEKGETEWAKHIERKKACNPRCREYWIKKGLKREESILKNISKFQLNNAGVHKTFLIKKYGKKIALQKYSELNRRRENSSLKYFIGKYGDTPKAYALYAKRCESKDGVSIKSFLARGYSIEKATELHKQAVQKRKSGSYSRESNLFFKKIIKALNLKNKKIYTNKTEWYLYDTSYKKLYLYDFTIFDNDIKCIVEYHGTAFHPSNNLSEEKFLKWKSPYSKQTADEVRAHDKRKKDVAIENGFHFLEVWSDEKDKKEKVINFLQEKLNL